MSGRVYVSSTYADLKEHRAAVCDVLAKMRYTPVAMENYVARDARVKEECLRDVGECEIYMGVIAWRYGHVPGDDNPQNLSITELEYLHAKELNKPRLIFLLDPRAPWPDEFRDRDSDNDKSGTALRNFRDSVSRDRMPGLFSTVQDLVGNAAAALHLRAVDARTRAVGADLASASCLTLLSSSRGDIVESIKRSIAENARTDVIKINLGNGESWWSTRLHLLAALCAEYTDVRQLLFEAEHRRFIGMCTPSQARRLLARVFPEIEAAYRESLPMPDPKRFDDSAEDVQTIVDRFSAEMDRMGGEATVQRWVPPHVVRNWPGVNRGCVDVGRAGVTPDLLTVIIQREDPFVVLVRDGIVQQVVDRAALATRIAVAEV